MTLIEPIILAEQRMFEAIEQVESCKVSVLMPQLKLIAHQNKLNLSRLSEFKKAVDILTYSRYLN